MKYNVRVNGALYEVEIERAVPGYAPQAPQYQQPQAPVYAQQQPMTYAAPLQQQAPVYVPPQQAPVYAPVAPVPQAPAAPSGQGHQVTSPMPGSILDLKVKVGDSVSAGQILLILEAMKMENEIVAEHSGTVNQILVSKGSTVETNDVLVVIN